MNSEINSKACNCLPDDADHPDVLEEYFLKLTDSISRTFGAFQLMTPSSSSLERLEQLEESTTDRNEQCILTRDSCSLSRMLESVG